MGNNPTWYIYKVRNVHKTKSLCVFSDPNETAKDMTDKYKTECANMRIRPIAKLLEQLEVSNSLSASLTHSL